MDRGTWQAIVHGASESQIKLSDKACACAHTHTHTYTHRTPTWEETKDSLIGDKKTEGLGKTKPQVKAELPII